MSTSELKSLLDELSRLGVVDVAFSGGEPLLRKDLPALIAYAREIGLCVGTSTSGTLLTESRAIELRQAGLSRLQVSIDGLETTHDRIRGAGVFRKAIDAVRTSVGLGIKTHICFTAMRQNFRELGDVIDLAASLGAAGFNLSQFVAVGRGGLEMRLSPAESRDVLLLWSKRRGLYPSLRLTAHLAGLAIVDEEVATAPGFVGCQAGMHLACVGPTGDVTPCVLLPLVVGNVREQPFGTIWDSSPEIQALKARSLPGACGACAYRTRCGGCRASAYAQTGDYLRDDPSCWLIEESMFCGIA
jgi:radical SAM protein with 4Fe4S-binding SPASM domain